MRKLLRVFISSPGDVPEERLRAHLVVQKLARDYARFFRIEPYLWEHEPMLASGHFQDAIEPPSESDMVVLVVYSRLGTQLPERTPAREYRGIDGRAPVTGTEWEFEEALAAHKVRGAPDLLAYRKVGDPGASLVDADRRAEQERQWAALESFWRRHFEGSGIFLAGSAKFRTLEEFDQKLESDLKILIESKIAKGLREDAGVEDASWFRGSPFRGLAAYDFDDAPVFFGRDAQIRAALTRLHAAATGGTAFLLILGASGSGKSSLARAGLVPALFAPKAVSGVGVWRRVVLRPGEGADEPVLGLAKALIAGDPAAGEGLPELLNPGTGPEALAAHLQAAAEDPSFPFHQALARVADAARAAGGLLPHETAKLVLVVDQLEELFTRAIDPARRALFVRILAGLARSGAVWVVATMRNDLWHRAAEIPLLVELVEAGARLDLPQPDGAELIEIVRRPAAAAGIVFETETESGVALDAVISRAASEEPGALPLLSVMLDSLYERDIAAEGGRVLTFASYRALGELKGAIARRADQALGALADRDPEAAKALPAVLRALVTASADGTATSRAAPLEAFSEGSPGRRLIEAFVSPEARLLVASMSGGRAEVRLAHESLLENWPVAREQIATDRRDLQTRARLEVLHRRWVEAEAAPDRKRALLTGLNLAEGVDLVRRWEIPRGHGLGAFVSQSEAAERWRRRSFAVAASILLAVFATIAAVATLQWRRAEHQTAVARRAEETEKQARAGAEAARADAVAERDRADRERSRAVAALRETKREAARTLAAQADLAAGRNEVRRALSLAVQAGRTERDVLAPGERAASEAALLKALADVREVLHVQSPVEGAWTTVPHDFLGDARLAYADPVQGLVVVDLETRRAVATTKLPDKVLPTAVRAAPSAGLVVMTGVRTVLVVDGATGAIRADLRFTDRITHLDVHDASHTAVVSAGSAVAFIDLDAPTQPHMVAVPDAKPDVVVGQVRFTPDGRRVLVGYGTTVYELTRDKAEFARTRMVLTAEGAGFDRQLVEAISAKGVVVLVAMNPDPTRDRVLMHTWKELREATPETGDERSFQNDAPDALVLGVSFTDQARTGSLKEAVVVTGRTAETGQEIQLRYVTEDPKPLAFESFRVSASDLGNEKPASCQVSRHVSFLVCQYRGKTNQGLIVWRLLGGKHRLERLVPMSLTASSGAVVSVEPPRVLVGTETGLSQLPERGEAAVGTWSPTWRLGGASGPYVTAVSAADHRVQVFESLADASLRLALAPVEGTDVVVDAASDRAAVSGGDRLALYDLKSGQRLAALPGVIGVRAVAFSGKGTQVVAVARDAAYVFDAGSGRLSGSFPIKPVEGSPAAIDPGGARIAFVSAEGVQVLDLKSGRAHAVSGAGRATVRLAFGPDGGRLYVGGEDGTVLAVSPDGAPAWTIASPVEQGFAVSAWPGQPPRGAVLQIAPSRDGRRVAVVRQDIAAVDLYDTAGGEHLTQLTTPWSFGVPADTSFALDDVVLTAWAVHAMAREKPRAVSAHALPRTFEEALATAEARLAALAPWRPPEPPGAAAPRPN